MLGNQAQQGLQQSAPGSPATADSAVSRGSAATAPPPKPPKPPKPSNLSIKGRQLAPVPSVTVVASKQGGRQQQEQEQKRKHSDNIGFSLWAHNLGYAGAISNVTLGALALLWAIKIEERPAASEVLFAEPWCGPYCLVVGIAVFFFEYSWGLRPIPSLGEVEGGRSPVRGVVYLILSAGSWFSYPTVLAAFAMTASAAANWMAFRRHELVDLSKAGDGSYLMCSCGGSNKDKSKARAAPEGEDDGAASSQTKEKKKKKGFCQRIGAWYKRQEEIGYLGQVIFVSIYVAINIVLFFQRLSVWIELAETSQQNCSPQNMHNCVSNFAPFAKAFGQTLNFNCAMLLLPVLRTLIRKLNNLQVLDQSIVQRYTPPLRKNVVFHKFVALFVLAGTAGHVFFHFLNLQSSPEATTQAFGPAAFVTGYLITMSMYVIYSAAQNRVKRAHYEIFWSAHHAFVVFFGLLFAHAPKFWAWGTVPIVCYVCERLYRDHKGRKMFYVAKAVYKAPVLCLSFFPGRTGDFVFKEGQYLYLLVPSLSRWEWHPFTISSAYEDLERKDGEVTLHIRVQKEGSWTHGLCQMFERMAPSSSKRGGDFTLELSHLDSLGTTQRGKHLGPDGLPLIQVDGPHAAPAQHYSEYREVMLVGAGIGLTPSSAIIQSILKHKWKKGFNPQTINFYYVVRHSEIFSFRWFIKLLTELQRGVASDYASGNLDRNVNRLQVHIFVTKAPSKEKGPVRRKDSVSGMDLASARKKEPTSARAGVDVNIGFDDADLELAMLNPTVSSKDMVSVLGAPPGEQQPNQLQNIWIWNGRPVWDDIFSYVKMQRRPGTDRIGVCFCGTPIIGKELKKYCHKYSSLQDNLRMMLHKENF